MEILDPDDKRPAIYWGQIHCHSEQSDGSGPFEDIYRYSRDEGCLDFAAGSDHAEYFTDNEWLWMQDISNRCNQDGRFITLNGYERAGDQGHWNFYTSADRLELFPPVGVRAAGRPNGRRGRAARRSRQVLLRVQVRRAAVP